MHAPFTNVAAAAPAVSSAYRQCTWRPCSLHTRRASGQLCAGCQRRSTRIRHMPLALRAVLGPSTHCYAVIALCAGLAAGKHRRGRPRGLEMLGVALARTAGHGFVGRGPQPNRGGHVAGSAEATVQAVGTMRAWLSGSSPSLSQVAASGIRAAR